MHKLQKQLYKTMAADWHCPNGSKHLHACTQTAAGFKYHVVNFKGNKICTEYKHFILQRYAFLLICSCFISAYFFLHLQTSLTLGNLNQRKEVDQNLATCL